MLFNRNRTAVGHELWQLAPEMAAESPGAQLVELVDST